MKGATYTLYTCFAKGRKMWQYPSAKTIDFLRKRGIREIVWQNGDFIYL